MLTSDYPVLAAAFVVMLLYLSLTLGKHLNCVESRPLISLGSLFATIIALIMGFGLASAFGYAANPVVLLTPFILLGVAVDDDIIIIEALDRSELIYNEKGEIIDKLRFGDAMRHAGLSITLTSFSSIVAFGIGSFIDMPGIASFCVFAAMSFLANFGMFRVLFWPLLLLLRLFAIMQDLCSSQRLHTLCLFLLLFIYFHKAKNTLSKIVNVRKTLRCF